MERFSQKYLARERWIAFLYWFSGDGNDKLLSIPTLAAGTGEQESNAVYNQLKLWRQSDKVVAMSVDTTAGNTGRLKGACTILELKLCRKLLWLACCHNAMELILSKVFTLCCGPSSAPEIPIFKRFKAIWKGIAYENFRSLDLKNRSAALD